MKCPNCKYDNKKQRKEDPEHYIRFVELRLEGGTLYKFFEVPNIQVPTKLYYCQICGTVLIGEGLER